MTIDPSLLDEFHELLASALAGTIQDAERDRLNKLLESSPELLEIASRNLEVESLLTEKYSAVPENASQSRSASGPGLPLDTTHRAAGRRAFRRGWWAVGIAVACTLVLLCLPNGPRQPDGENITDAVSGDGGIPRVPDQGDGSDPVTDAEPSLARLSVPGWQLTPTGDVDVRVIDDHTIELNRGELYCSATVAAETQALTVLTPHGLVTTPGAQFLVGVHAPGLDVSLNQGSVSMKPVLRVLVIAGLATLSNSLGEVSGSASSLLAAEPGKPPVEQVVKGNSQFALDLYGRLSEKAAGENVFFSPFSVSSALAMVAEGARGQTAVEFGNVLHFPEEARRIGSDAQLIPWKTSLFHTGMAQLYKSLSSEETEETVRIREQLNALEVQLNALNVAIRVADTVGNDSTARDLVRKGRGLANQINVLRSQIGQYELNLANGIWTDQSLTLSPDFVQTMNEFYGIDTVFSVDFQGNPEAQRTRINQWAAEQTQQMIPEVIPAGSIDNLTRLVLANAVYFRGEWVKPFEESQTRQGKFVRADATSVQTPLMYSYSRVTRYAAFQGDGSRFPTPREVPVRFGRDEKPANDDPPEYPDADGFEMVEMPYKGGEVAMYLIAPRVPDGLPAVEALLSSERLNAWTAALQDWDAVKLTVPKFSMEENYQLEQTLPEMGLVQAFRFPRPDGADFSGLVSVSANGERTFLSQVIHKARIEVNEKGTRAAAVTAVVSAPDSAIERTQPFIPEFRADRPFLFLIRHKPTGTILFIGRMTSPSAE